ncbi:MAG: class IV adenylate cyclase [Candidatus Diapherotrites archaeon]|jgi:adenylate cyclase, class 2|uniref:Class IV adenylate cyclase n=1 Tax=Candidatus Iainarchaeum sp. TaxID=3101447 RepID=A0A8T5GDW2_9ARCH|nr:class IV adenylate cyclase [Candidatus Diapherotrites archaeon]MBT7241504.1 class IV adenylate cyclase [Candidatus Diapherotrites archaeon]
MKEVEVLVKVLSKKNDVLDILNKFNFIGKKKVLDIYFYDEKRDALKPKEGKLTECFRLRKKDKNNYITYKIDYFDDAGTWIYSDEEETQVNDFRVTTKIISHLGLKPLIEIDNIKHTFLTNEYEIVLEEVKGLGLFLEVERQNITKTENISEVKQKILDFINSLGIKVSKELNAGKPELMLKKNSQVS